MLRINLVLRFVFLGLLVKFGDVSYASFEDDCKSSKEISAAPGQDSPDNRQIQSHHQLKCLCEPE